MGVGLLFDASLEEFLEREGDAPGALWFFLHIPKTAGSSFRSELARSLRPSSNLTVDYKQGEGTLAAQRAAVLDRFVDEMLHNEKPYRFASGHVQHPSVERIAAAYPKTRIVTMLRDPVKRLVSEYRYQLTDLNPLNARFRERFPSFDAYARDESSQNKMYKFLAIREDEPVPDIVARMVDTYSFVGLQEMYALSFRLMSLLLGRAAEAPTVHTRKTPSTSDNELDSDTLPVRTLRDLNALDQAIFDHFRRLFVERREAIQEAMRAVSRQRLRA